MNRVRYNREMPAAGRRAIAFDCKYFRGDRPCSWHKAAGALCTCEHYVPITQRILMIKLDAMGDVLRTTALLPAIAEAHPGAAITWITRRESVPLLEGNPYLADVIELGPEALLYLQTCEFDRVVNLDASRISAAMASAARSARKDGFVLDPRGFVQPTNDAARAWLEAGLFDDVKRAGTDTYQDRMAAVLGLETGRHGYVLELTAAEIGRADRQLASMGVSRERPLIGLNTGAGGRWPLKAWREDGYLELIHRLARQDEDVQFLLLGGPSERDRNARLKAASAVPLFDAGCDNPVRQFAAIMNHCDVVVTGDTLAMHIALARRRRTVVLFGPTSAVEIEMYGLGEKVVPDMTCLSCYKTACDFVPNCMDLISTDMVLSAVVRQLNLLRHAHASASPTA